MSGIHGLSPEEWRVLTAHDASLESMALTFFERRPAVEQRSVPDGETATAMVEFMAGEPLGKQSRAFLAVLDKTGWSNADKERYLAALGSSDDDELGTILRNGNE